jgi:glyoxylate/hydroxypyruvate reductase A
MAILLATDFGDAEWAAWWPALQAALPGERLLRSLDEAGGADGGAAAIDVALVANPPRGALAGLPRLRLVQSLWAGVDKLLADPTVPAEVPLARMVDPAMNEAMAETVLWAVLSLHRAHFAYARQQRAHEWRQLPQRRADEVNVAVLGLGQMGRCCALRLAANGYRVSGWSARPAAIAGMPTHAGDAALEGVLRSAEIVVNLLPLTPATRGLFDARRLAMLPRGAALINVARGAHVVDADLLAALDAGQLSHAVLDVFAAEPLPPAHPFWSHPGVTVLPHVAALTDARSAARIAARNVHALREGRALENVVDRARGY